MIIILFSLSLWMTSSAMALAFFRAGYRRREGGDKVAGELARGQCVVRGLPCRHMARAGKLAPSLAMLTFILPCPLPCLPSALYGLHPSVRLSPVPACCGGPYAHVARGTDISETTLARGCLGSKPSV